MTRSAPRKKKPYVKPHLATHGSVEKLTQKISLPVYPIGGSNLKNPVGGWNGW